jgi:hypothetical protein
LTLAIIAIIIAISLRHYCHYYAIITPDIAIIIDIIFATLRHY